MFWSNLEPNVSFQAVGLVDANLKTVSFWKKQDDSAAAPVGEEEHEKGVVYYLNDKKHVVGILLWNIEGKLDVARHVISRGKEYDPRVLAGFISLHKN